MNSNGLTKNAHGYFEIFKSAPSLALFFIVITSLLASLNCIVDPWVNQHFMDDVIIGKDIRSLKIIGFAIVLVHIFG